MKVLHVADFLPGTHTRLGGAEFAARRIIDEQAACGIEVEVATLQLDAKPDGPLPWRRHHVMRNMDRYAPGLVYAVKQLYFPGDPLARRDLRRIIKDVRPDFIHFHNLHFSGMSIVHEARAAGVPSAWSVYDYWIFCPSFMLVTNDGQLCTRGHGDHCVNCIGTRRARALKPVKKLLFSTRKGVFEKYTDVVGQFVVLSNASSELLAQHGIDRNRISVVPQYIWKEAIASPRSTPPVSGRLTYVGWVEYRKGLHVIVQALGELAAEFPQLHLEVLGMPANAAYEQQINGMIDAAGIRDRVNFRGKISRKDLLQALRDAWLVTVPEQWENMSPVILTEAMAAGACVLASRIGGIRHFVEEKRNGLLAERDNVGEYVQQIRWAIENPEAVHDMGNAARERAQDVFDPERINTSMQALYSRLIQAAHS